MNFSQLGWASGGPRSASGQISIVIRACNEDDDYDNNGDDDVGDDDYDDDDGDDNDGDDDDNICPGPSPASSWTQSWTSVLRRLTTTYLYPC